MQAAQTLPQTTTIDLNARTRFEKEIAGGYVGIAYIESITNTVKAIPTHNREFRDAKRGARDAQRAKVHLEAAQLKGGEQRLLSFYLELGIRGKLGAVVTEEIAAEAVRRTTGGACKPRTYRRHLAALCRRGWLHKSFIPTGTRAQTEDGTWTAYKVLKVTLSPAARLLCQKTYIALPRPKRPTTEGYNRTRGIDCTIPPSSIGDKMSNLKQRGRVVAGLVEELPKGNVSTRPASPSSKPTVKHETLRSAPRKAAKSKAAAVSARETRTGIPRTWRTSRRTLLAELFAFFHADPICDELHRVAELQTDRGYPSVMMMALDWDPIVRRWLELSWHDRRRCLKNEIAPPLRAFCAHLARPECKPSSEIERQHAELSAWFQIIPDEIPPGKVPAMVRDRMISERDRLNMLVRQIHAGRVSLSVLSPDDHTLLHQAGLFFTC
jgi:hypothetical protein